MSVAALHMIESLVFYVLLIFIFTIFAIIIRLYEARANKASKPKSQTAPVQDKNSRGQRAAAIPGIVRYFSDRGQGTHCYCHIIYTFSDGNSNDTNAPSPAPVVMPASVSGRRPGPVAKRALKGSSNGGRRNTGAGRRLMSTSTGAAAGGGHGNGNGRKGMKKQAIIPAAAVPTPAPAPPPSYNDVIIDLSSPAEDTKTHE